MAKFIPNVVAKISPQMYGWVTDQAQAAGVSAPAVIEAVLRAAEAAGWQIERGRTAHDAIARPRPPR